MSVLLRPSRNPGVSSADTELAYTAAQKAVQVHRHLAGWMKTGMTLVRIDAEIARVLKLLQCRSAFLGYKLGGKGPAFPSHACLSVNECVTDGTAASLARPLRIGDLLKVHIGLIAQEWVGKTVWTYHFGRADEEAKRFTQCGKTALREGMKKLRPGSVLSDWSSTVQRIVEVEGGYHCLRGLGGSGYGRKLHSPPWISNVMPEKPGDWEEAGYPIVPGMLVSVQTLSAVSATKLVQGHKMWPVTTANGCATVAYEHCVLTTQSGPRVLTDEMESIADEIH